MMNVFEIKSRFTKFMHFTQKNIFVIYEKVAHSLADNFYAIDRKRGEACFLVNNIYPLEKKDMFTNLKVIKHD